MTLAASIADPASFLMQVANPAARALAIAAAAGFGLAAFRVRSSSLRLFTWTAVLYAALALPVLGWMLPGIALPTPAFLLSNNAQVAANQAVSSTAAALTQSAAANESLYLANDAPQLNPASSNELKAQSKPPTPAAIDSELAPPVIHSSSAVRLSSVAAAIYLAVAMLLLARLAVGIIFSRRLLRSSQRILESHVRARLALAARSYGLTFVPQSAESESISVPVTMGALRSTILLPAAWREWDGAKLDAVIAHEMSHVARRDALTQRLSLLHRAIFWFSPLAWWLDRRIADLAEQASDEAALSCGADRHDYARTLLGFFEALQAAPGRVWWQGVSMAKSGQAEQRVERILAWRGAVTMSLKKSSAVVIIALVIPAVYLAAAVRAENYRQSSPATEQAQEHTLPAAATATPPSASTSKRRQDIPPVPPNPALAPVAGTPGPGLPIAPLAAIVAMPPPAVWMAQSHGSGSSGSRYSYHYGYDDNDNERFVIASGKSDSLTMSGSTMDARHVEKLRKQIPGDFIWFQHDEESYIIRDQATIDRARRLWAPQEELGKKQEELGRQQELLGQQQEALSQKMERVRINVPDMTAELDKLKAKLQKLGSTASMDQIGDLQSEIGELQSKIGDIQSHAGDQQGKLGEEQGALGEKQGKLGEQQGELGRQQGELAEKSSHEMKQLLDEAITKGTAQPEAKSVKSPTL